MFGAKRRVYPRAAHDDKGHDVLPLLMKTDQKYPGSRYAFDGQQAQHIADEKDIAYDLKTLAIPDQSAQVLCDDQTRGYENWPAAGLFVNSCRAQPHPPV